MSQINTAGRAGVQSSSPYDVDLVRKDFPILQQKMRGKRFVYLDNAATSLKPQSVIDAEIAYYTTMGANIHRGVYEFSERATLAFDAARESLRAFINVPEDGHIVFTKGATEGVNMVASGWGRRHLQSGDEIVTSELEHHANLVPWQELAREKGLVLKFLPIDPETGTLSLSGIEETITDRTRLVAITAMSNVTGYLPPVKEIVRIAHAHGAIVLVDGAQYVSHHKTDVTDLDCDFLVFSGHKMLGPTGTGVLYGKEACLDQMTPYNYGGDMIVKVYKDRATYRDIPERFEAGTPNVAGVIGLGAAVRYLLNLGMDNVATHERNLIRYLTAAAEDVPGIAVYATSDTEHLGGIFSFNLGDVHSHDTGAILDNEGIAVRTGFHCAQPYMRFLGIPGTVRASLYLYNTTEEIDIFIRALARVKEVFG
ncbi:MAG TPA: cysteine desulfurase [Spirochaetia bacterium]|nr:cysteine desulfurase [Spirochaetia bacterium]